MMTSRQSSSARASCPRPSIEAGLATPPNGPACAPNISICFGLETTDCVSTHSIVTTPVGIRQRRAWTAKSSRLSPRRFSARYSPDASLGLMIMASIGDGGTTASTATDGAVARLCLATGSYRIFPLLLAVTCFRRCPRTERQHQLVNVGGRQLRSQPQARSDRDVKRQL